jgi:hypothetical protein
MRASAWIVPDGPESTPIQFIQPVEDDDDDDD